MMSPQPLQEKENKVHPDVLSTPRVVQPPKIPPPEGNQNDVPAASPGKEQRLSRKRNIEAPTEGSRAQTATKNLSKFASKSTKNRP